MGGAKAKHSDGGDNGDEGGDKAVDPLTAIRNLGKQQAAAAASEGKAGGGGGKSGGASEGKNGSRSVGAGAGAGAVDPGAEADGEDEGDVETGEVRPLPRIGLRTQPGLGGASGGFSVKRPNTGGVGMSVDAEGTVVRRRKAGGSGSSARAGAAGGGGAYVSLASTGTGGSYSDDEEDRASKGKGGRFSGAGFKFELPKGVSVPCALVGLSNQVRCGAARGAAQSAECGAAGRSVCCAALHWIDTRELGARGKGQRG